jgi:hypothetical protein
MILKSWPNSVQGASQKSIRFELAGVMIFKANLWQSRALANTILGVNRVAVLRPLQKASR